MEFWAALIVVEKEQSIEAAQFLRKNCTHVDNWCWIFEGEVGCLDDCGVRYNEVSNGAIPCIGGYSAKQLVDLCQDVFGVDIYDQKYKDLHLKKGI